MKSTYMNRNPDSGAVPPKVSIGMPVYNGEPFIAQALDSILGQSYPHFELLISDNASIDRTQAICTAYAQRDPRIRYLRQTANLGATANFRHVLHESTHERFIWAAADDWWSPNRLERLVASLRPEDAAVVGEIRRYVGDTAVAAFVPLSFSQGDWWRYVMREEARCEKVYYIYGLLWRDKALKAFAEFKDGYWEDAIFCYRLLWLGNLCSVVAATLHVTAHHASSGTAVAASFRYSIARLLYRAHPWAYYARYVQATPGKQSPQVRMAMPIKAVAAQLHLWWRAVRRIVFARPYLHGALAGGEDKVRQVGL